MGWAGSDRRDRLPRNWASLRLRVLEAAGYGCQWVRTDTGLRCGRYANQCDHVIAGDDHSRANLQALCEWHHKLKTGREATAAREARRKQAKQCDVLTPFEAREQARRNAN